MNKISYILMIRHFLILWMKIVSKVNYMERLGEVGQLIVASLKSQLIPPKIADLIGIIPICRFNSMRLFPHGRLNIFHGKKWGYQFFFLLTKFVLTFFILPELKPSTLFFFVTKTLDFLLFVSLAQTN
jgi:hypothetical protein